MSFPSYHPKSEVELRQLIRAAWPCAGYRPMPPRLSNQPATMPAEKQPSGSYELLSESEWEAILRLLEYPS